MTNDKKIENEHPVSPMHVHLKQVVWYQLAREGSETGRDDGKLHRLTWLFRPEEFPCGNIDCEGVDTIRFIVLPTGVYRTCKWEGFTEHTDPIDTGPRHLEAILLEDIVCTNEQAIEVVKMYHQERLYLDSEVRTLFPPYRLPRKGIRKP